MRECPACGGLYPDAESACPRDGQALALPGETDPLIGQVIGSYTVVSRLGQGGMGTVYLGQHPGIGSQVAIKILSPRFASDPVIVERFFNEARAANLIGHENIVHIFDFGHLPDGTPYFVMEWLNGRPLAAMVGAPMPTAQVLPIALQIVEALRAAHGAGIVHRDLKPENIFIVPQSRGPQVKVLDFGIAKLSSAVTSPTAVGVVMGTVGYLSPEQAAGDTAKVSPASDIYSLGVILYQLASGHLPFEGSDTEVLAAHLHREPPPLPAAVPRAQAAVILRCLRKQPAERFASMRELGDALTSGAIPRRRVGQWRWVAAAALALGAVAAAVVHWRPATPPPPAPVIVMQPAPAPAPVERPPQSVTPADAAPAKPAAKHASKPAERGRNQKASIPTTVGDGFIEVDFDTPPEPH